MNKGGEDLAKYEADEKRRAAVTIADVLKQDGIPKRIRGAVSAGDQTPATEAVDQWMGRGGWCLCLSGQAGVGKSFAAGYWLWRRAVDEGRGTSQRNKKRWFPLRDPLTESVPAISREP